MHTESTYKDRDDAIRAAIDRMQTGDVLTVHERHCKGLRSWWRRCTCTPEVWTCP